LYAQSTISPTFFIIDGALPQTFSQATLAWPDGPMLRIAGITGVYPAALQGMNLCHAAGSDGVAFTCLLGNCSERNAQRSRF